MKIKKIISLRAKPSVPSVASINSTPSLPRQPITGGHIDNVIFSMATSRMRNVVISGGKHCFMYVMDNQLPGDTEQHLFRSRLRLYENGIELGPAHTVHANIATKGGGAFSDWQKGSVHNLFFSTSDGTDPTTNGRSYTFTKGGWITTKPITRSDSDFSNPKYIKVIPNFDVPGADSCSDPYKSQLMVFVVPHGSSQQILLKGHQSQGAINENPGLFSHWESNGQTTLYLSYPTGFNWDNSRLGWEWVKPYAPYQPPCRLTLHTPPVPVESSTFTSNSQRVVTVGNETYVSSIGKDGVDKIFVDALTFNSLTYTMTRDQGKSINLENSQGSRAPSLETDGTHVYTVYYGLNPKQSSQAGLVILKDGDKAGFNFVQEQDAFKMTTFFSPSQNRLYALRFLTGINFTGLDMSSASNQPDRLSLVNGVDITDRSSGTPVAPANVTEFPGQEIQYPYLTGNEQHLYAAWTACRRVYATKAEAEVGSESNADFFPYNSINFMQASGLAKAPTDWTTTQGPFPSSVYGASSVGVTSPNVINVVWPSEMPSPRIFTAVLDTKKQNKRAQIYPPSTPSTSGGNPVADFFPNRLNWLHSFIANGNHLHFCYYSRLYNFNDKLVFTGQNSLGAGGYRLHYRRFNLSTNTFDIDNLDPNALDNTSVYKWNVGSGCEIGGVSGYFTKETQPGGRLFFVGHNNSPSAGESPYICLTVSTDNGQTWTVQDRYSFPKQTPTPTKKVPSPTPQDRLIYAMSGERTVVGNRITAAMVTYFDSKDREFATETVTFFV